MPDIPPDPSPSATPPPTPPPVWPSPPSAAPTVKPEDLLAAAHQKAQRTQDRRDLLDYLHLRSKKH